MKFLYLVAVLFLLSACSPVGTKNVTQVKVTNSVIYATSKDKLWGDAIEWFAINNIPIDKIEKDSGLISSKYGLPTNQEIVDCGTPTGNIGFYQSKFDGVYANINVLVREKDDATRVTINVFGDAHVSLRNAIGLVGESSTKCYSTGVLEDGFHVFIGNL